MAWRGPRRGGIELPDTVGAGEQVTAGKQEIRAAMRARRRALGRARQRRHALLLATHVARRRWFRRARHVALYIARDGEIDLAPLMQLCFRQGKAVYLPRIDRGGRMQFARHHRSDQLVPGRYGIPEPRRSARSTNPAELEVVFAPLVAFTLSGERLGMGGGYYDRAFAARRRVLLVGAAHSCQQVDKLPHDPWDITMDCVMTERGPVQAPFRNSEFSQS